MIVELKKIVDVLELVLIVRGRLSEVLLALHQHVLIPFMMPQIPLELDLAFSKL